MAKQTGIVDSGKLYAYRLPGEKKFFDFALKVDPDYHGFKGICFVSPPRHPHMIKGKLGKKTATGFTFIADTHPPPESGSLSNSPMRTSGTNSAKSAWTAAKASSRKSATPRN